MASDKILEMKIKQMEELKEKLLSMESIVLTDYRGLTVTQDTILRADMRAADVEYKVIKNRLIKKAIEGTKLESLIPHLEGPTAVAMSKDELAAAKLTSKYAGIKEYAAFQIKGGFVAGEFVDIDGINTYAKIPAKNDLIAMMMGGMKSPITSLALVLKAIMEKQQEEVA